MKSQINIRVSDMTRRQLDQLTARMGTSITETITVAIDRLHQQEQTMNTYETTLQCTAGSRTNPVHANVQFSGSLTPAVALDAARRAFGHADGVTVTDPRDGTTYRCTGGKARKVQQDPALWMAE